MKQAALRDGLRCVLLAVALLGCRGGDSPPQLRTIVELPATPSTALDLLFVIDDSGNTAHLQQNLGDALPAFFDRLGPRDLHVGVVTSDLGTSTSRRQRNYDGELSTIVRQMVRVGSTGCGFEQPLAAMRAALDTNPANAGFVRPDATLAVVLLMDEDDCSVRDAALFGPDTADNPQQSFRCTRSGVTCLQGGTTPVARASATPCSTPHRRFGSLSSRSRATRVGLSSAGSSATPSRSRSCSALPPQTAHRCRRSPTRARSPVRTGCREPSTIRSRTQVSACRRSSRCSTIVHPPGRSARTICRARSTGSPIGSRSRWALLASRNRSIPPRASSRMWSAR